MLIPSLHINAIRVRYGVWINRFLGAPPTVTITSTITSSSTSVHSIPVTFTFSENVTGFTSSDVIVADAIEKSLDHDACSFFFVRFESLALYPSYLACNTAPACYACTYIPADRTRRSLQNLQADFDLAPWGHHQTRRNSWRASHEQNITRRV